MEIGKTRNADALKISTMAAASTPYQERLLTDKLCPTHQTPLLEVTMIFPHAPRPLVRTYCNACEAADKRQTLRDERHKKRDQWQSLLDATIPERYRGARLWHIAQPLRAAIQAATKDGFVLFGPPGRGKTYTLAALIRVSLLRQHESLIRISWDRLLLQVRGTFRRDAETTEEQVVNRYSRTPLFIVEDLGATVAINQEESAFSTRVFTMILDERLENRRPTWISTNKPETEIAKSFDARIASRLKLLTWIGVGGKDKRARLP